MFLDVHWSIHNYPPISNILQPLISSKDSTACWLFGDQATLVAKANATSGPRSCTAETAPPAPAEPVAPATVAPAETVETNASMAWRGGNGWLVEKGGKMGGNGN